MTITLATGATVVVTEQHPFMVVGEGWVLSGRLRVGDHLAQRDGGAVTIAAIQTQPAARTVYNFEVAGDHNYYITDAQLLVHNCANRMRDLHSDLRSQERDIDREEVWSKGSLYTQVDENEDTRLVKVMAVGNGRNHVVIRSLSGDHVTAMEVTDDELDSYVASGKWN